MRPDDAYSGTFQSAAAELLPARRVIRFYRPWVGVAPPCDGALLECGHVICVSLDYDYEKAGCGECADGR